MERQDYGGSDQKRSSRAPRKIVEVEGGYYDNLGFYNLPSGGFYDPDGYHFNAEGYDEFGGYYDEKGFYHPGELNKHEFQEEDDYEDDLIRQYEEGHYDDEDANDEYQEKLFQKFKKEEQHLYNDEDDEFAGAKAEESKAPVSVPEKPKTEVKQQEDIKEVKKTVQFAEGTKLTSKEAAPSKQEAVPSKQEAPKVKEEKKVTKPQQAKQPAKKAATTQQQPAAGKPKQVQAVIEGGSSKDEGDWSKLKLF